MMDGFGPDEERGGLAEWFSRHQRILALLSLAAALASIGVVLAFLASNGGQEPARRAAPVATYFGASDDETPSEANSPSAPESVAPSVALPSVPLPSSPSVSPTTSTPLPSASPAPQPGRTPGQPQPDRPGARPSTPAPTVPTSPPTRPPADDRHSIEIEVIGERTFVAVGDEHNNILISRRMRPGARFTAADEDFLRVFVENRRHVRIIVDGVERPMGSDDDDEEEGPLRFVID